MTALRPAARALAAAALLAAALAAPLARAIEVPELRARVMDRAGVLSPAQQQQLEARLRDFERQHGHQVVVHTTPSLEGLTIEDYSMQVAEQWKIGQKGLDDGVIFTVAPSERRVRIEVGYGLEGTLTDADASRIVREVREDFRRGDLAQGIQTGVDRILAVLGGQPLPPAPAAPPSGQGPVLFWALLGLMVVLSLRQRRRYGWWDPYPRSYRSGGFGGGGGFSGGGGRFGGGGASGSW